jgi:hypothetical protein
MALPHEYDVQRPAGQPTASPAQRLMNAAEHLTNVRRRVEETLSDLRGDTVEQPTCGTTVASVTGHFSLVAALHAAPSDIHGECERIDQMLEEIRSMLL